MPIYEYERPDGTTFEVMQSFEDDPLTHDPEGGAPVRRVFHAPAVHFKGKGFYNTDYGTRRRQREMAAQGSSSSSSESSSDNGKQDASAASSSDASTGSENKGGSGDAKAAKGDGAKKGSKPEAATAK